MPRLSEVGEWALIRRVAELVGPVGPGLVGIGDDAAVGTLAPGASVLTTMDLLVEGVHFRRETTTAQDLGHKALAVNLSDIAAMGGVPRWAVVGLALPPDLELDWVLALYAGMLALARETGTALVGGDTVRAADALVISIAVTGEAATPLGRNAARPGDVVFMTGPAGLAAAGLWCLAHPDAPVAPEDRARAVAAQVRPQPQLAAGRALSAAGTRLALMDNSDGLARSAIALAEASQADLILTPQAFPIETATQRVAGVAGIAPARWVLDGGEDYGLVGCVGAAEWPRVRSALAACDTPGTVVGEVVAGPGRARVKGPDQGLLALGDASGFAHFG